MSFYGVPPIGTDLRVWAEKFTNWIQSTRSFLTHRRDYDSAAEDGVILYDRQYKYPVISRSGEFRQVVLEGGHAKFMRTTAQTAAAANTAYSITYDAPANKYKIDRDATNNERIVFEEAGEYLLSFTAEITASAAANIKFYFWPAKNGTNIANMTMIKTIHNNGGVMLASRAFLLDLAANDYIEMKWAVDSTNGSLGVTAATSFSPASPSSTLAITRIHA
mgnify:CR=1 FL=1|tara:strand:+ start:4239 stop:4898 length:660 start_codon:yes stop_codon:yes gene_type:complete